MVTATPEMRTIPIGLASFQGQYSTAWNLLMAGSVIALLPVLIIYIFGQNLFVRHHADRSRRALKRSATDEHR
ncbi:MAG: hypothetical protein R2854_23340 [Caldilineaceae bacterium]